MSGTDLTPDWRDDRSTTRKHMKMDELFGEGVVPEDQVYDLGPDLDPTDGEFKTLMRILFPGRPLGKMEVLGGSPIQPEGTRVLLVRDAVLRQTKLVIRGRDCHLVRVRKSGGARFDFDQEATTRSE